ncbi:MAG TPA: hypothetical protein VM221_13140 [Armatimonadota bacterium]|nr:hypothetical protein [Armatimonadota bacterium]
MPLTGRIARIVSPTQVVLNIGRQQGVTRGMAFIIYEEGDMINDPITNNDIERLEIVKGRVVAEEVQESLTFALTVVRTYTRTQAPPFAALSLLTSPREVSVRRRDQLPVDDDAVEPLASERTKVRKGDLVREEPKNA